MAARHKMTAPHGPRIPKEPKAPERILPPIDWSEYCRRFNLWLESDEGKKCTDGTASGTYLRNRLLLAANAAADIVRNMLASEA